MRLGCVSHASEEVHLFSPLASLPLFPRLCIQLRPTGGAFTTSYITTAYSTEIYIKWV